MSEKSNNMPEAPEFNTGLLTALIEHDPLRLKPVDVYFNGDFMLTVKPTDIETACNRLTKIKESRLRRVGRAIGNFLIEAYSTSDLSDRAGSTSWAPEKL